MIEISFQFYYPNQTNLILINSQLYQIKLTIKTYSINPYLILIKMSSKPIKYSLPPQRTSNSDKKKQDHILALQHNLKLMKSEAQQFLKKGNKELPPIIKARHYLYLNFLKQNLTLSPTLNDDKPSTLRDPSTDQVIKSRTLTPNRSYSRRNKLGLKNPSAIDKNPEQNQSVIVIKRNNKKFIKIFHQQPYQQINQLTGKSVEILPLNNQKKHINGAQSLNFKNNIYETVKKLQNLSNSFVYIDENITKLRQTQQVSNNMLKSLHADNIPFRYSKLNLSQEIIPEAPINPKNLLKNNEDSFDDFLLKQKQRNETRMNSKQFLFGEKLAMKEKPKTIPYQTLEPKIEMRRKQKIDSKVQNSILDYMFAPTKNILNPKSIQSKMDTTIQKAQSISPSLTNIEQQANQIRKQNKNSGDTLLFSPIHSVDLSKLHHTNPNLFCSGVRNAFQIPPDVETLLPTYNKKWIQELEVSKQKLNLSRYLNLEQTSDIMRRDDQKTHYSRKRTSLGQNKLSQQKMGRKQNRQKQSIAQKAQSWQPWSSIQVPQMMENYNFQEIRQLE